MATQFLHELTDTWNSGVTDFRAIKMSVTDGASGVGSRLLDFEVNGNSRFVLDKLGNLAIAGTITMGTALAIVEGGTGAETAAQARTNLGIDGAVTTKVEEVAVLKSGSLMTGPLSVTPKDHGTLGSVTQEFKYADGNVHEFTCNGAVTINPTGLAAGKVLQINFLYQGGSIAVSGTTQWELGGGVKSASIVDVGVTLAVGLSYCIIFEVRAGIRTGVFT